jgi:hypothetical protein
VKLSGAFFLGPGPNPSLVCVFPGLVVWMLMCPVPNGSICRQQHSERNHTKVLCQPSATLPQPRAPCPESSVSACFSSHNMHALCTRTLCTQSDSKDLAPKTGLVCQFACEFKNSRSFCSYILIQLLPIVSWCRSNSKVKNQTRTPSPTIFS